MQALLTAAAHDHVAACTLLLDKKADPSTEAKVMQVKQVKQVRQVKQLNVPQHAHYCSTDKQTQVQAKAMQVKQVKQVCHKSTPLS
jgi:hypothetical protein